MDRKLLILSSLFFLLVVSSGCSSVYFATVEKFGYHKRDLLQSRVSSARQSQKEAKEEFKSALEQFSSIVYFDGGDIADKYATLSASFEQSENKANEVRDRIDSVENVAEALFDEWEDEIGQYSNANLRRTSTATLTRTRARYRPMIEAMRRAEESMNPVLDSFRDQVLFLKHNLNARAIASLKDEVQSVESNISQLLQEMDVAIKESEKFTRTLESNNNE
ncbi:MAG: DUF2959 domain-containing protein [bacterium]|nr:DUF2959 domain-containing protein [bacterium]